MVQKQSLLVPADKSGVWLVRVIHTYTKLSRVGYIGSFGKISTQACSPNSWLKKKRKRKYLLVRVAKAITRRCGVVVSSHNSPVLLKKRLTPLGRRVGGFITLEVRRRRAIASFISIL